jgi:hypothetical protein
MRDRSDWIGLPASSLRLTPVQGIQRQEKLLSGTVEMICRASPLRLGNCMRATLSITLLLLGYSSGLAQTYSSPKSDRARSTPAAKVEELRELVKDDIREDFTKAAADLETIARKRNKTSAEIKQGISALKNIYYNTAFIKHSCVLATQTSSSPAGVLLLPPATLTPKIILPFNQ